MTLLLSADFHQGSDRFPLSSRGKQCVANCLVFHALLNIIPLNIWSTEYLNTVLEAGDELYRFLISKNRIVHDYLAVSDLPKFFMLFGKKLTISSGPNKKEYCGTLKKGLFYNHDLSMSLEFALNLIFPNGNSKLGAILIFCESAVSILRHQNDYYIFDPHSRCVISSETLHHL